MAKEIIDDPFGIYEFDESAQESYDPIYPLIQWHNGQQALKKDNGIMGKGGFFINSREQRKAASLPDWKPDEITFDSGESETGPASTSARIAVIRSRRCWQEKTPAGVVLSHWNDYAKGKSGRQQWLIAVEGCSEFFVFSVKGTNGQAMETAIAEHQKKVVAAARSLSKKNLPLYAFWLTVAGGEFVQVGQAGQQKWVTPPHVVLPAKIEKEFLINAFVGQENLSAFQQAFTEGETWAKQWSDARMFRQFNAIETQDEPLGATDYRVSREVRRQMPLTSGQLYSQPDDYNDYEEEPSFG